MNKKYAIFDMDGTLIDSMVYWKHLATEYLERKGVKKIPSDLQERIKPMTMTESAALFVKEFGVDGTPDSVAAEMNYMMDEHYRNDIPLKEGVDRYLEALKEAGVKMCVASATAEPLMRTCLERLGVADYFEFLLSCEEVGVGKNRPDVNFAAAERLAAEPEDIVVYEDALYAAETAKNAAFYVVGVYDESADAHWNEMEALADEVIKEW